MSDKIHLTIDGRAVSCAPNASVIQAYAHSGEALTANVGCMGQGVCGSCRCLVRRDGERETRTLLACETRAEAGMQVSFIDYFAPAHVHHYSMEQLGDAWQLLDRLEAVFPEAAACRHCGGCDRACPRGLAVQDGVALARGGQLAAVAAVFDHCVMCNLCTLACPENIRPNHLGLFVRRALAAQGAQPADLLLRLRQQRRGDMAIDQTTLDDE
ncbi:MAG: 2Fe-2S iron-sulfur cluster-binding protein [Pseudomonadota bacterium]